MLLHVPAYVIYTKAMTKFAFYLPILLFFFAQILYTHFAHDNAWLHGIII